MGRISSEPHPYDAQHNTLAFIFPSSTIAEGKSMFLAK